LVSVPPSIDGDQLETIQVLENGTAYLSCRVSGTPRPSVIWYKNDVPLIDHVSPELRRLDSGKRLEVRKVATAGHRSVYRCQAVNVAGLMDKTFVLKVLGVRALALRLFNIRRFPRDICRHKSR